MGRMMERAEQERRRLGEPEPLRKPPPPLFGFEQGLAQRHREGFGLQGSGRSKGGSAGPKALGPNRPKRPGR